MDEARLSAALKLIDPRYCLQKHRRDGVEGGWVYKVICLVSDTYAPVVWTYMDEHGTPLPLSSGLLEQIQRARLDSREKGVAMEEHNRQRELRARKLEDELVADTIREHRARVAGRLQVSLADVQRKRQWLKKNRGLMTGKGIGL